jgi:hypothetical protein
MAWRASTALSILLLASGAGVAHAQPPPDDPVVAPPSDTTAAPSPEEADATEEVPPPPAPPPPPPTSPQTLPPGYSDDPNATSELSVEEELVAAAVTVEAPPETPVAEEGPTHRGFFLRPHVSVGYLGATGPDESLKGLALGAGVSVGFAIVENLILFGEFMFQTVNGGAYDGMYMSSADEGTGLDMVAFGGGIAYYVMPLNLHFALAGSVTVFQIHVGTLPPILNDPAGFGFNATVGKEWWLGGQWGLGIAAQALLGFADQYTLFGVGLAATLTFN